ncbi:hypothetical protein AcW1_001896 [Taiwanofungus camphoratus]|nr:hypothetical protein AcV5_000056 [Antrodia cinnamomea]KAI0945742.1 hypothetical protein AcW1_001896 [Antrodia cinnamomea]
MDTMFSSSPDTVSNVSEKTLVDTSLDVLPAAITKDDAVKITKNARAREFFWALSFQKPVVSVLMSADSQMAARSGEPNHLRTIKLKSKVPPSAIATRRATGNSVSVYTRLASIPLIPLDSHLQAYFLKMERTARNTCHPREIHTEAVRIVNTVGPRGLEDIPRWVKTLFFAGIARLDYSRTIAVLVHDLLAELLWRSWQCNQLLRDELVNLARTAFCSSWDGTDLELLSGTNGIDPLGETLERTRTQMLNIAAFVGDLFALGVLPSTYMRDMVTLLVCDPRSMIHCRALYLLLLRACPKTDEIFSEEFLLNCRQFLVWKASNDMLFVQNDMARRWLIEICNVIDATIGQNGGVFPVNGSTACHRWNKTLSFKVMTVLLQSIPNPDYGLLTAVMV